MREFLINKNRLASLLLALLVNLQGISYEILKIGYLRYLSVSEIPKDLELYVIEGYSGKASY